MQKRGTVAFFCTALPTLIGTQHLEFDFCRDTFRSWKWVDRAHVRTAVGFPFFGRVGLVFLQIYSRGFFLLMVHVDCHAAHRRVSNISAYVCERKAF